MCWYLFPVCLQFRLRLMCKQGTVLANGSEPPLKHGFKNICSNLCCLSHLPYSLFLLTSARSQKHLRSRRREPILDSWTLGVSLAIPSPPRCSLAASAGVLLRSCWGIFLAWSLCFLLLINLLWATSRTLKCGKLACAKYFFFSLFVSLNWFTCRGHARGGLNKLPDNRQLLKLPCFVQLQPKSSPHCSLWSALPCAWAY